MKKNIKKTFDDVAVIGMSCRLPGAANYHSYWNNLCHSINSIKEITTDRWDNNQYYSSNFDDENKSISKWGGLIDDIKRFDSTFFHISSREAENMDPQQRLLLEESWHCLEDAGILLKELQQNKTSVFIGVMATDYQHVLGDQPNVDSYTGLGNYESILANRISYCFGLNGESKSIDTACSSSLVAIHDALNNLQKGDSDYAIAGGVSVICHPWKYISFSKARMLSPTGQCKTFDKDADGYVPGEGVGLLLLTPLKNAIEKGYRIHGIIKSAAVNHNAQSRSITAPRVEAQQEVIELALEQAKVKPSDITYIEAHGTGTSLGDPIEVEAIKRVLKKIEPHHCGIGSVKTNIGHLEAAAGVAGVIKVLLMMKHQQLVPTLNLKTINPLINIENSPIYFVRGLKKWDTLKRIAGVSSFGFGGVNSHVILEEYVPNKAKRLKNKIKKYPITFSAKSESALQNLISEWEKYTNINKVEEETIPDISNYLIYGRESFDYRIGAIIKNKLEFVNFIKEISESKNKNHKIIDINNCDITLEINSLDVLNEKEIKTAISKFDPINQFILKIQNEFKTNELNDKRRNQVNEFIYLYVLFHSLINSGIHKIKLVKGNGIGEIAAMSACGMISYAAAIKFIINQVENIYVKKPTFSLYLNKLKKQFEPCGVTNEYLVELSKNCQLTNNDKNIILEKSKILIENQYTFKKIINEWQIKLKEKLDIDLTSVLKNRTTYSIEQVNAITLILYLCISELDKKWNLSDAVKLNNKHVLELSSLYFENIIDKSQLIQLLLEPSQSYIADEINKNSSINKINSLIEQGLINNLENEMLIKFDWKTISAKSTTNKLDSIRITLRTPEENNRIFSVSLLNLIESLPQFLLSLWETGLLTTWSNWYTKQPMANLNLPTYSFSNEVHWIPTSHKINSEINSAKTIELKTEIEPEINIENKTKTSIPHSNKELQSLVTNDILKIAKKALRLKEILADNDLSEYAMDSIAMTDISMDIEELYKIELTPDILYEHKTFSSLSSYIIEHFNTKIIEHYPIADNTIISSDDQIKPVKLSSPINNDTQDAKTDIAIIGMSGIFPGSPDLSSFIDNLLNQKDLITDIPTSRWTTKKHKINRAGLMQSINEFDAAFFNISPGEAELMDPQQRILLQSVWRAIEDAGYASEKLTNPVKTGVFVGVCNNDYGEILDHAAKHSGISSTATYFSILANRVSFLLNLIGPSEAVDTACSSSLVALHNAVKAIHEGDCDVALAAGVNALLSPTKFVEFEDAGMLSPDGKCKTFDASANGYVRGEGVGVVLLKPLNKALADNDHIYGVIKGTSVNHGGRVNSLTVPNPNAQADLITSAVKKANIDIDTITYIETHGTGTALGDPIEVNGLKHAFQEIANAQNKTKLDNYYCGLGSVKTNIGHLESGSGMAGLIKVLLAMQQQKIPGIVNFKELNPYVKIQDSPFYIVDKTIEWKHLVKDNNVIPYRAGISSFGFGGANAHVILEESPKKNKIDQTTKPYYLVTLSAKTELALKQKIEDLTKWLNEFDDNSIANIAYTLNSGRSQFDYRCVLVVANILELKNTLTEAVTLSNSNKLLIGMIDKTQSDNEINTKVVENTLEILTKKDTSDIEYKKNIDTLANLYIKGYVIDWELLHHSEAKQRIALPTYPFARNEYCIPFAEAAISHKESPSLHPLIDSNISTLEKESFTKKLTKNLFYLTDHQVQGNATLPGVAYLEMARAAGLLAASNRRVIALKDVTWLTPIFVDQALDITIGLYPLNHDIAFEVTTNAGEEKSIHSQGKIIYGENQIIPSVDKEAIIARCSQSLASEKLYQQFESMGLRYGQSFQSIKTISFNDTEVIARLELSDVVKSTADTFMLHPSLMDGALQSIAPLLPSQLQETYLPFSMKQVEIYQSLPATCYVYVNKTANDGFTFNVQILDEQGQVCVVIHEFVMRAVKPASKTKIAKAMQKIESFQEEKVTVNDTNPWIEKINRQVTNLAADILKIPAEKISPETDLSNYGMDSISFTIYANEVNDYYELELTPAVLFEHKTLGSFTRYLAEHHPKEMAARHGEMTKSIISTQVKPASPPLRTRYISQAEQPTMQADYDDIAVIGMDGIFPGSANLENFWQNLIQQKDLISEIPPNRWDWHAYYGEGDNKTKVKWGGFIEGIDEFDAEFFNFSTREAELMDPQQRLFLQTVWKAIEQAGYLPDDLAKQKTGLFVGVSTNDYHDLLKQFSDATAFVSTGNVHSVLANRISYLLNLSGPSMAVDTACSSSLVAIHQAVLSIQNNDCDVAIAGGVNALLTPSLFLSFSNAGMLCEDGRCKTFDKAANGYVRGEGVGAVILKPLKKALADGDTIYGVIKGTAVNHGGHVSSLTVPNPVAQAELIATAIERARIGVETISYIETHGTGTSLGDPIEVNGLKKAFSTLQEKQNINSLPNSYCGLGTVKTNIGHLEAAAGIAGFIKVLLAMQHKTLPGLVNFHELNPYVEIDKTPFYLVTETKTWEALKDKQGNGLPRRAGISSFGFGGANAHVIVEEAPELEMIVPANKPYYLITLSAKSETALQTKVEELGKWLTENKSSEILEDISYTLNKTRKHFNQRLSMVVNDVEELITKLNDINLQTTNKIKNCYFGKVDQEPVDTAIYHEVLLNTLEKIKHIDLLNRDEYKLKLNALANLYVKGYEIDWELLHQGEARRKIPLSTYPFEKKRYWYNMHQTSQLVISDFSSLVSEENAVVETKNFSSKISLKTLNTPSVSATSNNEIRSGLELDSITKKLQQIFSSILYIENNNPDINKNFVELGIDSILGVEIIKKVNDAFQLNIPVIKLYDYPTIEKLAQHLYEVLPKETLSLPLVSEENAIVETTNSSSSVSLKKINTAVSPTWSENDLMQGVLITGSLAVQDIKLDTIHLSDPDDNEIQVLIKASTVTLPDLMCVNGLYPSLPEYPFSPGFEFSGMVIKKGKNVTDFTVGDEVFGLTGKTLGGQASQLNISTDLVIKKPGSITHEEAASLPVAFLTAYHALKLANLHPGEKILIQTAASSTGLMAIQLALLNGADIYATVGSEEKRDYLQHLGIKHTINYHQDDFETIIKKETKGKGVDVILNMLAGDAIQKGFNILAPEGRYLEIAVAALKSANKIDLSHLTDNQCFYSIDLRKQLLKGHAKVKEYLTILCEMIEEGRIKPIVDKVFDFKEVREAYEYIRERKNIGRVVLRIKDQLEQHKHTHQLKRANDTPSSFNHHDIAIIGFSGRFPGADNTEMFWKNLTSGQSSITEIPKERWSIEAFYDSDTTKPNKSYSKWGGFLNDIDQFDPLFFNISPLEAELMDPQQRLFLEESWKTFEMAGYTVESIANKNCGIFVGVAQGDYYQKMKEAGIVPNAQTLLGSTSSILVSRMAYFLDLKGPSMAIDTACSSSLVAIHQACTSLWSGECEMALAGGVNVMTTPDMYIMMSKAGMLSKEGKCKTFDNAADGMVPSEGVGAVLLKPLHQALLDHDCIYAVIKGSHINQDGRTNGITAPNGESQMDLEEAVYKKFDIHPESISYIEAHGTGTKLGDPIEVAGLTDAFKKFTNKKQFCAMGSVKTNIGHALTAAGISSVIKTILCLQHKKLVPSINFTQENEHIDFKNSPFYVNTNLKDWASSTKRRAAISSFGFSGTNAHLVLEEAPKHVTMSSANKPYYLLTLSAKSENALQNKIDDLRKWLTENESTSTLEDISYTLNKARNHFNQRVAIISSDINDLATKLTEINLQSIKKIKDVYIGNTEIKTDSDAINLKEFSFSIDKTNILEYKRNIKAIAKQYVKGYDVDWNLLHQGESKHKISLPTYPFERNRYWIETSLSSFTQVSSNSIYPLIDTNISTLEKQCFSKKFTNNLFYLSDHQYNGNAILPGVAYLEMARTAGVLAASNRQVISIKDITWLVPIFVDQPLDATIGLYPINQDVLFEVTTTHDEQSIMHAQGKIIYGENQAMASVIDRKAIIARCSQSIKPEKLYQQFESIGLHYGPSFQTIKTLSFNDTEVIAKLELPDSVKNTAEAFMLHPSLMDGALQSVVALLASQTETYLPFSMKQVDIHQSLPSHCYVYVNKASNDAFTFNLQIMNEQGQVCVAVHEFVVRAANKDELGVYYYQPIWKETVLEQQNAIKESIYLFSSNNSLFHQLQEKYPEATIIKAALSDFEDQHALPSYLIYQTMNDVEKDYGTILELIQTILRRKPTQVMQLLFVTNDALELNALSALAKTIHLENSLLQARAIQIEQDDEVIAELSTLEQEVKYQDGKRYIKQFETFDATTSVTSALTSEGVYLITGGAGGLGMIMARYLATTYKCKLVLSGRSKLNDKTRSFINELADLGATVTYIRADITDAASVKNLIKKIKTRFGKINGIIHSAGILQDAFLLNKTQKESSFVLAPKIKGT